VIDRVLDADATVFTDPVASPTGFPFKVVRVGTGELDVDRGRVCDLGYLRTAYEKDTGGVGWRCPAEPVGDYVGKGGDPADTVGRQCLCNALMANIGLGQRRPDGRTEPPILTAGDDLSDLARFLAPGARSYSAAEVVRSIMGSSP
jgi:nitronate monooxygenase